MDGTTDKLLSSHSFYTPGSHLPNIHRENIWKSDMHIPSINNNYTYISKLLLDPKDSCGEYYKKYEHDELPVKVFVTASDIGTGDSERIDSLTNNMLMKYGSQDLLINSSSFESLESNVKFFKATVQELFDIFYANMRDIEVYKKRYQEILKKNRAETINEMEDFVKDMIQHIISTDPSDTSFKTNRTYNRDPAESKYIKPNIEAPDDNSSNGIMVESFINNEFMSGSSTDDNNSSCKKHPLITDRVFNIYFLNTSGVEIKINDRSMLSEINIKDKTEVGSSKVASADNLRKFVYSKNNTEVNDEEFQEMNLDREIPIKVSCAKKDIYLNEDFHCENDKMEKSFLSKICSYICKRFRKN